MIRNRKAETSGGQAVAVLMLVIGLFIVLYILLLPPEERRALLEVENQTGSEIVKKTILSESPGLVKPAMQETTKHEISSVNLFVKSQPEIDFLADNLIVKKGWFSKSFPKIIFDVDDLKNLNKVNLYFKIVDSKGTLRMWLNGREFYSERISESDLKIIDIPKNLIISKNELRISLDTPLAFWSQNIYSLSDVSLKKEYSLVHKDEKRLFSVSQDEKEGLKSGKLNYFIYCNELEPDAMSLKISLNQREIFSGLVRCIGSRETIDIDAKDLRKGTNELNFEISDGDFLFSDIFIETDYKSISYPIYYFTIDSKDYDNIQNNKADAALNLKFGSSGEKSARFLVNDNNIIMKASGDSFSRNIDELVENGDNFIKIIPSNSFTIDSLKISLE